MNASFSFLKDITTLTGGTSAALDSVNTSRLTLPYFAKARITLGDGSKQMQGWLARTRVAEAESSGAAEDFKYVLPDNWHVTTNNVVWERVE
jgi:hypothetical protein